MMFFLILSRNGQMTLKIKVYDPHFQYLPKEFLDTYLVQILAFWLRSITSYCADKPNFPELWFKMANMTLRVKVNEPEQLECLHSENTRRCPMIIHTVGSYWIPSQNKTKFKLQIWKTCQTSIFFNFAINFACNTPIEVT